MRSASFLLALSLTTVERVGAGEECFVLRRHRHRPYLILLDKDDDGVFDLLTYSVLDTEGNTLFDVED